MRKTVVLLPMPSKDFYIKVKTKDEILSLMHNLYKSADFVAEEDVLPVSNLSDIKASVKMLDLSSKEKQLIGKYLSSFYDNDADEVCEVRDWQSPKPFVPDFLLGLINSDLSTLIIYDKNRLMIEGRNDLQGDNLFDINDGKRLNDWFAVNRYPKRVIDPDYDKHKDYASSYKGKLISAQPFANELVERWLHYAVGNQNARRRYFKINKHALMVYYNENLEASPTYHCHIIWIDDKAEIAKIPNRVLKKINTCHVESVAFIKPDPKKN